MFWIFPIYDLTEGKQTAGPRETSHVSASLCRNAFNGTHSPPPTSSFSHFHSHVQLTTQEVEFLCDCLKKWSHFPSSQNFLWAHAVYFLFCYFNILLARSAFLHSILSLPVLVFASSNPLRHILHAVCDQQQPCQLGFSKVRGDSMDRWDQKRFYCKSLLTDSSKEPPSPSVARQISVKLGADVFGSHVESVASPLSKIRQRFTLSVCLSERNWNLPLPNLFPAPPHGNVPKLEAWSFIQTSHNCITIRPQYIQSVAPDNHLLRSDSSVALTDPNDSVAHTPAFLNCVLFEAAVEL